MACNDCYESMSTKYLVKKVCRCKWERCTVLTLQIYYGAGRHRQPFLSAAANSPVKMAWSRVISLIAFFSRLGVVSVGKSSRSVKA